MSRCSMRTPRGGAGKPRSRYHGVLRTTGGLRDLATETTFDVGTMRVRILDDGVFITDAGNLFGGSRKMRIRGAMHAVLVETGENLVLIDEGLCELQSGGGEVVPGIRVEVRSGHSAGHQIAWIGSGDDAALYTADLAPARIWLDPDLISGGDTDPEAARKNRIEVLEEAESKNSLVILYHEPGDFLVNIRRTEKGFEGVPIKD